MTLPTSAPRVIPALLGLLSTTRRNADVPIKTVVQTLPFQASARQVKQWEAGKEQPGAGQLDAVVWAYATLTKHTESELWGQALLRAATHPRVIGAPAGGIAIVATDNGDVEFYT